jgi:hypothetical protein
MLLPSPPFNYNTAVPDSSDCTDRNTAGVSHLVMHKSMCTPAVLMLLLLLLLQALLCQLHVPIGSDQPPLVCP